MTHNQDYGSSWVRITDKIKSSNKRTSSVRFPFARCLIGSPARNLFVTLWFAMYTVKDLAERFGLHPKRVRERLAVLSPLIDPYLVEGKQNAKLLTDGGLAIFDRLIQLEREGLTVQAAVQKLQNELSHGQKTPDQRASLEPASNGNNDKDELIAVLKEELQYLRQERDRLLGIIENQSEQLRALLPGPKPQNGQDGPAKKLTRWQALKIAILGR